MKHTALIVFSLLAVSFSSLSQSEAKRIISDKGVFLFGPSEMETDSVPSDESEALSDFATYSTDIARFARSHDIFCAYVTARLIEIRYGSMRRMIISRDTTSFGTILTDGIQQPRIFPYVTTGVELREKAKEFFKLP